MDYNDEKKEKIFAAAVKEFSENGYDKASTNSIIKEAGVSKGLLFHYFVSKKKLYWLTIERSMQIYLSYFDQNLKKMSDDIFERIVEINLVKMQLALEYPLMQKLLTEALLKPPNGLIVEIKNLQQEMINKYMPLIIANLNYDSFKEGLDVKVAINFIMLVVDALGDKYIKAYQNTGGDYQVLVKEFIHELELYANMMKFGLYKNS